MYVRLAFAVAAHLEPEILIVDEVLAVGDAEFQKKCLGKMGEVSTGQGRTVLFVSHNLEAIQTLCRRCIWLDQGCVKEDGRNGIGQGEISRRNVPWLVEPSLVRTEQIACGKCPDFWVRGGQCEDHYRFLEPAGIRVSFVTEEPDLQGDLRNRFHERPRGIGFWH